MEWLDKVKWDANGLVPVIAQENSTGDVLMFAWMNREALAATRASGQAVYWSRSRARLWHKGEESGHIQKVHEIRMDCDKDVILLKVTQLGHEIRMDCDKDVILLKVTQLGHEPGVACHTGRHSCFYRKLGRDGEWHSVEPVLVDPDKVYKK